MSRPEPSVKHPVLPSAGFADQRVTRHSFVRTERVEIDLGPEPRYGWAVIYACDDTGAERRWGFES